jgi:EmrB/QacA subfamily drug resistance transporter
VTRDERRGARVEVVALADATSEATFGGKAASLARTIAAGLPVPDGFAIGWQALEERDAILAAWHRMGSPRVAVRSSAIGEDSHDASFAGQHATVLNVETEEQLLAALQQVRASAATDHAHAYRARMSVGQEARIAVVVQAMIDADVAGVLFTRNPVTGVRERVIESSWGLGEAVVAGLVTPDRFRVANDGQILERTFGRKDVAIRRRGEEPVPREDWARLSLSDEQLVELHQLADRCERLFGSPQDLEWAFAEGRLALLQSRPITTGASGAGALPVEPPPNREHGEPVEAPPNREHGEPVEALTPRRFAGLALAALLAPLNSTIIAVALPSISAAFTASPATVTRWMVTAYLLVTIVAQSPAGKLADLWGASRVLTLGRAMFGLGAVLAALSPSLAVLSAGRVLMAVGGALTIPTVFAFLRRSVSPEKRGRVFGLFGAIMSGAAAAGPILGGVLTERFGWHSIFIVNVPVVLLSFLLEPPSRRAPQVASRPRFDVAGSVLLALTALLMVIAVERANVLLGIVSLAALVAFIVQERRASDPVLDMRLFRQRTFAAATAIIGLQNLAMYAMLFLLPFALARGGSTASQTGRVMLLFTLAMVIASPLGGRASDAVGARIVTCLGALIAASGAALFVSGDNLFASVILAGAGIGLSTGPAQAAGLSAIPAQQAGVASGVLSTMRYAGGVIGSGIVGLLVVNNTPGDPRLLVFPAVLLAAAIVALALRPHDRAADEVR